MTERRGPDQPHGQRNVMVDGEVVPSSLQEKIYPILRVASEVEASNQRVAYICRFCAFEAAHKLDPTSSGPFVRQFKSSLLERLKRENEATIAGRQQSDACEIQSFYQHYCKNNIHALLKAADRADRAELIKAYQSATVLFEIVKAVDPTADVEVADEVKLLADYLSKNYKLSYLAMLS